MSTGNDVHTDGVSILNISQNPEVYQVHMDGIQYNTFKIKAERYDTLFKFQGSQEAIRQELHKMGLHPIAEYIERAQELENLMRANENDKDSWWGGETKTFIQVFEKTLQRIDRIERFLNHPGHTFNTFE